MTDPQSKTIRTILEEVFNQGYNKCLDTINDEIKEKKVVDQALKEIEELIDGVIILAISVNQKGQFEDDGGNICWYLDDLEKALRNNLKELLK